MGVLDVWEVVSVIVFAAGFVLGALLMLLFFALLVNGVHLFGHDD
jgi:hypothetical protein